MDTGAGIVSTALYVPPRVTALADILHEEVSPGQERCWERLGIEQVHVCSGESGSDMGLAAAREAIRLADIQPGSIDVIVDYSVMPQDYLVPAWSMSNKLQFELGATKSYTIGFSGGLCSTICMALKFVGSLVRSDEAVQTVLLVGADRAISGNRAIGGDTPCTILGDGASAMVVARGRGLARVIDTAVWTDGAMHDVLYVPGGAMAMPDRGDLYRLRLDEGRYEQAPKMDRLYQLATGLLERHELAMKDISYFLYPNLSHDDRKSFAKAFGLDAARMTSGAFSQYGHMHNHDFMINFQEAAQTASWRDGAHVLLLSHGMGFTYGATLLGL